MLLIPCPWCGPRSQVEFTYGGDASVRRPRPEDDEREWHAFVFLRDNPRGAHEEWWQHAAGCRAWFRVQRDTLSHEIHGSAAPGATLEEPVR